MDVIITPAVLSGTVRPPASKSQAHRAVLALALSGEAGELEGLSPSQDIEATQTCVAALGTVSAPGTPERGVSAGEGELPLLDCGESGSTLRFLIPVALAVRGGARFTGRGRLMERPQGPYFDLFNEKGIFHGQRDGVLTVRGTLPPGEYRLRGDVSSQFVTGLLYALPLLDGDSEIVLTTPLESRDYVAMTLDVLERFGVRVSHRDFARFFVPGNQRFRAPAPGAGKGLVLEADWSQAGFWYAARSLGNPVEIAGLDPRSAQGDRVIADHFAVLSRPGDAEIDVSQCPDLVPPLAAMAAVRRGTCRLVNAARLRLKESDRLLAVTAALGALGADIQEGPDSLTVRGRESLAGGVTVDSFHDHRIAMMTAVAATRCEKPVTVAGAECVAKSYPAFWAEYRRLGGMIREDEIR